MPEDFGVFALASSLLVFVTVFTGFGSQEAIVQCRDESISDLIPTAFWISLAIGLIVAVAGVLTGLAIWPFYGRTISLMIIALSVLTPLNSLANARAAVLMRNMVYKPVTLTQSISNAASFVLGAIAALLGMGPWALLVRQVSVYVVFWLGMEVFCNYRLQRAYNKDAARWIWDFGWRKMFMQISEVILGRYDNLMIGTFMGDATLGYYSQAHRLALLSQQFTQGAIAPVLQPMFATVQFSADKLLYGFERVFFWACRAIPLLGALILLFGGRLVTLLYGEKWSEAGQYFEMMFVLAMFLPFAGLLRYFLVGAGHIGEALRVGWIQTAFLVIGVTIGALRKDILFVIWSVNLSYVLAALLMGYAVRRVIPVNWLRLGAVPVLAFGLTIALGHWSVVFMPETFLGTILSVLALSLLYVTTLAVLENRSLRKEIGIMLEVSRRN